MKNLGSAGARTRAAICLTAQLPYAVSDRKRSRIDAEIEKHLDRANALIALLDQLDGDPDLEPSIEGFRPVSPEMVDLEGEHDGCEPDGLCWPEFE
ncbi:MAG TPA: hypothetical protein VIM56_00730 [Rhizomicrobium sp.]